jgi:monoamine oxidase
MRPPTGIGDRSWTLRGSFADGQLVERGGQLIDQGHAIRHLVSRLGLRMDNLLRAEANGTEPFYYFDGRPYTYDEATRDFRTVDHKLHRDVTAAGIQPAMTPSPNADASSTRCHRGLDQ